MLSLIHTLVGLPLGIYWQNPLLIFTATFILHLILDAILHWNIPPPIMRKTTIIFVMLDITGGLLFTWLLVGSDILTLSIIAAIAGSNAPDIINALWEIAGKPKHGIGRLVTPFALFHNHIQWETKNIALGLISQIILVIAVILIIT